MDRKCRVVEPPARAHRRAHEQHRRQVAAFGQDARHRLLHRLQQRGLLQQVVDRVGRQAELREQHDGGTGSRGAAGHGQRLPGIERGIGHAHPWRADGRAHEAVGVDVVESRHVLGPGSARSIAAARLGAQSARAVRAAPEG